VRTAYCAEVGVGVGVGVGVAVGVGAAIAVVGVGVTAAAAAVALESVAAAGVAGAVVSAGLLQPDRATHASAARMAPVRREGTWVIFIVIWGLIIIA
jgi:hypothetical protein